MSLHILGKTVKRLRLMSPEELIDLGWEGDRGLCLELSDGTKLFPSRDEEGNGPGALFFQHTSGEVFRVQPGPD